MKEFIHKYIFPGFLIVAIIAVGYLIVGEIHDNYKTQREVDKLQSKLIEVKKENKALKEEVEGFQDPETLDREARERLNLKKEGEHVVMILPSEEEQKENRAAAREREEQNRKDSQEEDASFWQKVQNIWNDIF